jgi:hypothetical protein
LLVTEDDGLTRRAVWASTTNVVAVIKLVVLLVMIVSLVTFPLGPGPLVSMSASWVR